MRRFSGDVLLNSVGFDALGADLDALHAFSGLDPHLLEIRKPGLLGLVLGMGHVMPGLWPFAA